MRFFIISLLLLGVNWKVYAQVHKPVKWSFNHISVSDSEAELLFTATLDKGWHIYSQNLEEGGPLPTKFSFQLSDTYSRVGNVEEFGRPVSSYDNTFMMDIVWYANTVVFKQKIVPHEALTTISGKIEFMVCTDEMCLPPETIEFSIKVETLKPKKKESKQFVKVNSTRDSADSHPPTSQIIRDTTTSKIDSVALANVNSNDMHGQSAPVSKNHSNSLWAIFLAGFAGGLLAIFMPCIFPMIPFTVSFFGKRNANRAVLSSVVYGLSIVVIYVGLGLGVTILFGSSAMNELATNGIFNFLFFLILTLFAASLFGAFEITLPASWSTQADRRSERTGLTGIFFMAATLALVSFSCTAPIVGTLLVEAATVGSYLAPAIGMLGFSLALAIPFSLFAVFPSWITALPKSGGWLNAMKVTLGFLELALALKFLSNVDLAYHWNWFDREVFLVLWIVIFALLGLYLLGKLKLVYDSEHSHTPTLRLFLAIITLAFALYMIPGLWGAPLKAISAFLPPAQTQDFNLYSYRNNDTPVVKVKQSARKYGNIFEAPFNLNAFFDYEEGLNYAKRVDKPIMIDFTGHACVNCRKMEAEVWSDQRVLYRLQNDYVIIQLYVDDRTVLESTEQHKSPSGRFIKTIGDKWSDFEASAFGTNAQPWYVLLGHDNRPLMDPQGADYDAERFSQFLDRGLTVFNTQKKSR